MKIGVMGCLGVVGDAVVRVMAGAHAIYGFDPDLRNGGRWALLRDLEHGTWTTSGTSSDTDAPPCDAVFICAPTPWDEEKQAFDAGPVRSCVKGLCESEFSGLIILKSTTLPTEVSMLKDDMRLWALEAGRWESEVPSLVACPEFLNARTAYEDLRDARHIIIGGKRPHRQLCLQIHKEAQPGIQGYFLDRPEEAMMLKYMQNTYFATKNALFNQFSLLCRLHELDYDAIRSGIVLDDRMHPVHTDVPGYDGKMGYGGMCLPKDVRALETLMGQVVADHSILAKVDEFNTHLRSTQECT